MSAGLRALLVWFVPGVKQELNNDLGYLGLTGSSIWDMVDIPKKSMHEFQCMEQS